MVLVAVGSVVQGSIGFGMAVVAAPILLLMNPVFVPGPMLLAAVFLVILIALRDRRDVIVGDVAVATAGRIIGTAPAALAIAMLQPSVFELLFAVLVIIVVALSVTGLPSAANAAECLSRRRALGLHRHDLVDGRPGHGTRVPA